MKIVTVTPGNARFPKKLLDIPSPPRKLNAVGDLGVLNGKCVSIVGSRKHTQYGKTVTEQVVAELAKHQVTIVSGLALGIDSIAHRAAVTHRTPTAAVMPAGLDEIYPRSHYHLGHQIVREGGLLLSEYGEGEPPLRQHFIERNRLVSGLADVVIIIEAAEKSGTLHTANFALEQGKTVMAVPGAIHSPMSKGTNALIKSGAEPLTKPEDAVLALGLELQDQKRLPLGDNEAETVLISLIAKGVHDVGDLQLQSQLPAAVFSQTLTMLELGGKIRSQGGGNWTIA